MTGLHRRMNELVPERTESGLKLCLPAQKQTLRQKLGYRPFALALRVGNRREHLGSAGRPRHQEHLCRTHGQVGGAGVSTCPAAAPPRILTLTVHRKNAFFFFNFPVLIPPPPPALLPLRT